MAKQHKHPFLQHQVRCVTSTGLDCIQFTKATESQLNVRQFKYCLKNLVRQSIMYITPLFTRLKILCSQLFLLSNSELVARLYTVPCCFVFYIPCGFRLGFDRV